MTTFKVHPYRLSLIVDDCKSLLQAIPQMEVNHVSKEVNKCVDDQLVALGRAQTEYCFMRMSSISISNIIAFDISENICLYLVPIYGYLSF